MKGKLPALKRLYNIINSEKVKHFTLRYHFIGDSQKFDVESPYL